MLRGAGGDRQPSTARGAYGFRIAGLRDPGAHLPEAGADWPALEIVHAPAPPVTGSQPPPGTVAVRDDRAEVWIGDGQCVDVDRAAATIRFRTAQRFSDDVVLHPFLGLPAAIAAHWLGRQVLHGGAFAHGDRAWAVLGDRESGKSSTLGWLLARGHAVLSDDILVLDSTTLFAGPRSVDLRGEAAAILGGDELGVVGSRPRWRLRPPPGPACLPLGGIVHLAWDDALGVERLGARERLEGIVRNSVLRPGPEQQLALLELAALPAWRLARPRDLAALDRAGAQLLAALP